MSLRAEARAEAARLLDWWADHLVDGRGGFHGEVDADGRPVPEAPKSIILNTRLLWFFSAMATWLMSDDALRLARRAFDYLRAHFLDDTHGGVYWLLDAEGRVIDGKKQAYAQAFAVYALAEYYRACGDAEALDLARELQRLIEARFRDDEHGGYIEALDRDWRPLADIRLSEKDLDAPKTMNTHLHILEGYTNLHRVAPEAASGAALRGILTVFIDRFARVDGLRLFYDMDWSDRTATVSFGHDIEGSWLLWEAAEALGDEAVLAQARPLVLGLARTTLAGGFNADGGLSYEKSFAGHVDPAGEWWGQAEGLVGFVNAWQMTGEPQWLDAAERLWTHIRTQFGAGGHNEWTWYAANAGREKIYKAGMWKCPYHNGRAMIELDRRLRKRI